MSLVAHRSLLSRLSTRRNDLETELSELRKIMDELVRSYNPNYQDMSVRAAARGYMELFYDGRVAPAEGGEGSTEPLVQKQKEGEDEVKQEELEALEKEDLDGLLVGWEDGTEGEGKGAVDELEAIRESPYTTLLQNACSDPLHRLSLQPFELHPRPSHRVVRLPALGTRLLAGETRRHRKDDHSEALGKR